MQCLAPGKLMTAVEQMDVCMNIVHWSPSLSTRLNQSVPWAPTAAYSAPIKALIIWGYIFSPHYSREGKKWYPFIMVPCT